MSLLGEINLHLRRFMCSNPRAVRWMSSVAQTRPRPSEEPEEPEGPGGAGPRPEPEVSQTFNNRNPRNLEQMALAVKDRGWSTTWPHREFYHRLVFTRTQHHVTAEVLAASGVVLSCSTREWAVKRELASTRCVAACQAVGEVLAHRCVQAGITRMVYRAIPWTYRSDAVQSFRKAMKDGGVTLSEPRRKYIGT